MQKLKIGSTYSLAVHTRFFTPTDVILKAVSKDGEWLELEIIDGEVQGLTTTWRVGDVVRFRSSLCTLSKL